MTLPIRQPGARATGEPCIVPANIGFCDACDCYRRYGEGWRVKRFDGIPYHFCPAHDEDVKPKWLADRERQK